MKNWALPEYPSTLFHFASHTQTFVAEISDLGPGFNLGRIFDIAAAEGFFMRSAKTGALKLFTLYDIDEEQMRFSSDDGLQVVLFND